ncbi:VTT domain-containing protein [Companilactobacillus huachuanensis]|uniref:VTT domain-containing protein n=1 Tax=Companilactobacillus huachuanensis TaxID=2559914 RepID=A0ABW1RLG5_9LACO|nr:VTT domain-containing protein [Companilactobacillus huachuanensis]
MITTLITFIFHLDTVLPQLMNQSGLMVYALIFLMIFIETGIVVLPFLPGDSLLFLCGSLAAISNSSLNPVLLIVLLGLAASMGDSLNFEIGKRFGAHISQSPRWQKVVKPKHLQQAQDFFARHGNSAIFLGRFMPIIRTLVPFTAGGSKMKYKNFLTYNIIGGFSWVLLCIGAGFFFGNIAIVKNHFSLIMLMIVVISLVPIMIISFKNYLNSKRGLN